MDGYKWRFDSAFSMKSLSDALDTLQIQRQDEVESMTPQGFNPLREYLKYAREQGYYAIFQQRAQENARTYAGKQGFIIPAPESGTRPWQAFHDILVMAAHNGTELHIAIYPYHAQILAMFDRLGWWPLLDQWKSDLVQQISLVQQTVPGAHIMLWDFSGFAHHQCQPIPGPKDMKTDSPWYWEAGHFKPVLGNQMLARMLALDEGVGSDFGYPLSLSTLAGNHSRIEAEKRACMQSYPQLFQETARLFGDT
jgi:hypothetical protein